MKDEEKRPRDSTGDEEGHAADHETGVAGTEPDLRSIMSGDTRRRVLAPEPPVEIGDSAQESQRPEQRRPDSPRRVPPDGKQRPDRPVDGGVQKLPPVWPGDEKKDWFRRERGLPPLPAETSESIDPNDLPTPLADIPTRGRAYGVAALLPAVILLLFPLLALLVVLPISIANLVLFRRGQDIGAVLFGLRVVRENGDVAGFFQMAVRSAAAGISLLALGAGFWAAFSDPNFRTWHDRWLGTYVVKDAKEYNTRKRSSSPTARRWFWVILFLTIALSILIAMYDVPVTETTPVE